MQAELLPPESKISARFLGDERKLRGGYYTPVQIARVLARWAIQTPSAHVLEPSCGDGELVAAAAELLDQRGHIDGVELFPLEAERAKQRAQGRATITQGDFFDWFQSRSIAASFDAVIGNPPFLRFHTFPEAHRNGAFAIMRQEGLAPTRLTNSWVPFVVAGTKALRPGGRLAMVLPAELLQVSYAAELRGYLVRKYRRLVIATFKQLLFAGTQQETILLFGIRDDSSGARMKWVELDGLDDLLTIDARVGANGVPADLDHAREKWIQYYLTEEELALVRRIEKSGRFPALGTHASVNVGVVTGNNDFFVVRPAEAARANISDWCSGIIGRSSQVPGIVLSEAEFDFLRDSDERCLLVRLPETRKDQLPASAKSYVLHGEELSVQDGYKCRIRLPIWWSVPSVSVPDAFMLRQIHDGPRIIANDARVTSTDTIHRIRLRGSVQANWLAAASINSMTFAFAEIRGRSYGGGVLELEPSEAEQLPFPAPGAHLDVQRVDDAVRSRNMDTALDIVDSELIHQGLRPDEVHLLRAMWRRLYKRRLARKPRSPRSTQLPSA